MRLSRYFLPLLRDDPKEAEIISHRLMLRAGLIRQASAGIYSWLPLGYRVLSKIKQIVREEQDRAGALELLMPTIQSAELWKESGRYEVYGNEMLRITDRHEREMLYGPTNEELITAIFRDAVKSYKDLPRILYHIQWKFRDEIRPRFGVMRGREFLYGENKNREKFEQAKNFFTRALELDPDYSQAYAGLGWAYIFDYFNRWSDDPDGSLRLARQNVDQAVEKDPSGTPTDALFVVAAACFAEVSI